MIDNITRIESLNPRQLAYIQRAWRLRKTSATDRTYKLGMALAGTIMVVALCLSSIGFARGWSPFAVWLLGVLFGISYAAMISKLTAWRLWPAADVMVDWNRIEEIANALEKSNPTA